MKDHLINIIIKMIAYNKNINNNLERKKAYMIIY